MTLPPSSRISPLGHDFLHDRVLAVNGTVRQREIRALAPMPFGTVLIARDDMDEATVRGHLQTMRELGFNAIKQFMGCPRWPRAKLEEMASAEGLCPWWYGEGGWEPVTPELCAKLGVDPDLPMADIREHPAMVEHQRGVLAARFGRQVFSEVIEGQAGLEELRKGTVAGDYGPDASLPEFGVERFRAWLRQAYGDDIAKLNRAWNMDVHFYKDADGVRHSGFPDFESITHTHMTLRREYRRVRDILRFKAELKTAAVREAGERTLARDPHEPNRSGGEMGLFLPFASRGTDMEGIATALRHSGSFYPSIHLCWHFEETFFEVARPVYMQAVFVVDLNKGGWTAPWESTGGPQQASGGDAPLFQWVRDQQPGFTVDAGVMTQLLLSYLAAGCKGVGLWSWNARAAGWEAGEFALLDRNEQVCQRTLRSGAIARAANRWRDEIWAACREPQVGILLDWDNEAIWAAMANFGRAVFKHFPMEARVGASRACIDHSIPFEYVTTKNLLFDGLAGRYPVLFLPCMVAFNPDLFPVLEAYVRAGGRLVLDLPGGCYDDTGRILPTGKGSAFQRIFGVVLADLQYAGNNAEWSLDGYSLSGYTAELEPAGAGVTAAYGDGRPASTENRLGEGTAVLLGWEAARHCYRPGDTAAEARLAGHLLGGADPFYRVEGGPVAYRLAAPEADHYFLINEGEASEAAFTCLPFDYAESHDVITGESVDLALVSVDKDSGRWIRCGKRERSR